MESSRAMPVPARDYRDARREYLDRYGSALVTNTYLRIALLSVSLVATGLLFLNIRTQGMFRNLKPLVIRINDVGRAEAVNYESFEYKPQDAEIRYFLMQFVTRHYGRRRAAGCEDYAASLYFLDGRLADSIIESNRKNKTIERFLAGEGDEIEIIVRNVSIEDLRTPPYKATVDFEKVYLTRSDGTETKRDRYIANFVFTVKERVPNSLVPFNPLGLTIVYFREDQAFEEVR